MIYVIGSLSNPLVEEVADRIRETGIEAFDQWRASKGDYWADYALRRKLPFKDALKLDFVETAFQFDLKYLKSCSAAVLVMPAGRSGGIELGWILGQGKPGYILYDGEPERPDLMAKLATEVFFNIEDLIDELKKPQETEYLEWYDVNNPSNRGKIRNPKYVKPSDNKLCKVVDTDYGLCPVAGIPTSFCWCINCERARRNLRGNWTLTPEMIGAIS